MVLSVLGLVRGIRESRTVAAVFGWAGIAFSLLATLALVSFPVGLFTVIVFVVFAPFVTLLSIIGLVGGILALVLSLRRKSEATTG